MDKECNKCSNVQPLENFWKNHRSKDGRHTICITCRKQYNRDNADQKKAYARMYEKTKKGFLMRVYRNMKSRIHGIQKIKHHLYEGKYLLPRSVFYDWAYNSPEFDQLFADYEQSGYERKLAPSVDRIDSSRGYFISNMEWVTMSENSRRGSINRHNK
jgi:hypothetical protein